VAVVSFKREPLVLHAFPDNNQGAPEGPLCELEYKGPLKGPYASWGCLWASRVAKDASGKIH